jgi:hypothetical protein
LRIWNRKEIENYLLVPNAIERILKKSSPKKVAVDGREIADMIGKIAEGMKEEVEDHFVESFHIRDKAAGAAAASKRAREFMKANWSGDSRLRLVGGKKMFNRISEWTQGRYGVSLSPIKIAAELERVELDEDIVSLITRIEQVTGSVH